VPLVFGSQQSGIIGYSLDASAETLFGWNSLTIFDETLLVEVS
jgi:hypothetical protein